MNQGLSYRLANKLSDMQVAAWIPPVFAIIGLIMVGMYFSGSTGDGGVLGFGVANMILSFHLLTVRGFGKLINQAGKHSASAQASE